MPFLDPLTDVKNFLRSRSKWTVAILLVLVLSLGAFLRFYRLGASGVGNEYYAATVKSMLVSWHNFFFAAFEPGGSLAVDKPPLGFWLEALSARLLGLTGFALALPNALAGVLSIFIVYRLVRRPFGAWAGLAAALVLAVMPVAVSTERNNTIDGLLVCTLLLAAWVFLQAVYTKKVRWLFLGAFIVGLGFNIKMLQAFLPLPAFYAVYFFGMKQKVWKKLLDLAVATALLLAVSFSWAVAVDLIPAAQRPYVDSTQNNTVMELIFGHNGLERLINLRQQAGLDGRGQDGLLGPDGTRNSPQFPPSAGSLPQPPANGIAGPNGLRQPPAGQGFSGGPGGPAGNPGNAGGQPGSMDFGQAGTLRLFTQPLVGEASWLLPFVLGGLVVLILTLWKLPFGDLHVSATLWAGWLLPEALYFTYSQGLMHAYYLIMLGAPLAALAVMTAWALWQLLQKKRWLGWSALLLLAGGTLAFQAVTLWNKASLAPWALAAAGTLFGLGLVALVLSVKRARWTAAAFSLLLAALLVAPAFWSGLTTLDASANQALPAAGPTAQAAGPFPAGRMDGNAGAPGANDPVLLDYLLTNTSPDSYLLAVDRANDAAPYILATGRPVLTLRGFLGQYNEISLDQFTGLVTSGRLRFVLGSALQNNSSISQWVQQNCRSVDTSSIGTARFDTRVPGGMGLSNLYDCGK